MKPLKIRVHDRACNGRLRPVTGGVPLPSGAAPRGSRFLLHNVAAGEPVPLQTRVLATWPDGSARWLLLDFLAQPPAGGAAHFVLSRTRKNGKATPAPPVPVQSRQGPSPRLRSGSVEVALSAEGRLEISNRFRVNLALTAASGARCRTRVERAILETTGAMRSTMRVEGAFILPHDKRWFGFGVRVSVYAGLSLVRLEPRIVVDAEQGVLQRLRELRLDVVPLSPITGWRIGGVPDRHRAGALEPERLFQVDDRNWRLDGTNGTGRQAPGWAELTDAQGTAAVYLRDFWQQWPKALEVGPHGSSIGLFPRFSRGEFRHMTPWYKYDYLFHGACYQLRTGQARRWDTWLDLGGDGVSLAAIAREPAVPVAEPAQAVTAGVWGDLRPTGTPGLGKFDAVEQRMFRQYLRTIRAERDYGAMNWGDWFGERQCNWGNHEYDTVNQLLIRFARTGDPDAFYAADVAARHSSEVDVVHHVNPDLKKWFRSTTSPEIYRTYPARPGMMHEHAVGHVGGFHSKERIRRLFVSFGTGKSKTPYLCLEPYNLGHVFCEGLVRHYFLTGDPWLKRTAECMGENLAALVLDGQFPHFEGGSHSGRVNGWTMAALAAVYELNRSPRIRRAMRRLADLTLAARDPHCGGWLYELPWGHCFCTTRKHVGEAGFITCVRLNGLIRYHRLTGDRRVPPAVCGAVTHLNRDTWMERESGWRYTSCPASAGPARSGVILSALAGACRFGNDPEHWRILQRAWDAQLKDMMSDSTGGPGAGKTYSARIYGNAEVASTLAAHAKRGLGTFASDGV